jgi:hypothetical protein
MVVTLVGIMERSGGTIHMNPAQIAAVYIDPEHIDDDESGSKGVIVELSSGRTVPVKARSVEAFQDYLEARAAREAQRTKTKKPRK